MADQQKLEVLIGIDQTERSRYIDIFFGGKAIHFVLDREKEKDNLRGMYIQRHHGKGAFKLYSIDSLAKKVYRNF